MAQPRSAVLTRSERISDDTKLLSFRMRDGALGFSGGQYLIVDTGIPIADNKIAKRAYSIVTADEEQDEFRLAVRRIGDGPGSNFMHQLQVGGELRFSGPWGKFTINKPLPPQAIVFATDTGITAALGLLRGRGVTSSEFRPSVVWLAQSDRYFLPLHGVIDELDRMGLQDITFTTLPTTGDKGRVASALGLFERIVRAKTPNSAYLSGDGAVVHAIRERLLGLGLRDEDIRLECFFNNPQRKVPT